MQVTASQIRQDLNNFGGFGQQGYGYNVEYLYNEIAKILGLDKDYNLIIVGAGNLGTAITNYTDFAKRGFYVKQVFDIKPELIGKKIGDIEILGMDIKGHTVHKVLIAAGADIAEEYYFSILLDRSGRRELAMCSAQGGMDIETLAREHPEALARVGLDPKVGIDEDVAAQILGQAGFSRSMIDKISPVLIGLWDTYRGEDATLVEVNPLVLTEQGDVLALDGKVSLDNNAAFRHPEHAAFADKSAQDPREAMAKEAGLNYVRLEGQVGVIGNGAGLVMSTLDVVALAGEEWGVKPANFLDIGGGASAEVMAKGLDVILGDDQVRSVFVNVFGGITACDQVARGIVGALETLGDAASKPLVVRLDGNKVEEGRAILAAAAHPLVHMEETMDGAARRAAELAANA